MKRYLLTRLAAGDLHEIKDFIAKDSTEAARRVVREIRAAIVSLAESPGIGHRHQDLDDTVKVWPIYSYLIIYLAATRPLQILRVVHGARDFRRLPVTPRQEGLP